jgi:MFS family permease
VSETSDVPGGDGGSTPRLRDVFAITGYRRLWAARTVSQGGDVFNFVARTADLRLDRSGVGVTGVVVAEILPVLLIAPLAGPLIDRWPRVPVMVASDLLRLVLVVALAVWHSSAVGVYAVAFVMSIGTVFFGPAAGSVLPAIVGRETLVAANSGIWTAAVLSQIALAPLAGLLVSTAGYAAAFAINAASYACSALILRGLRIAGSVRPIERRHLIAEAREGVRILARHRLLRALAVGQLLAALSAGATSALLVVLAKARFGVTGTGYGALIASIGVGAAIGPLLLISSHPQPSPTRVRLRPVRTTRSSRPGPRHRHRTAGRNGSPGHLRRWHLHRRGDVQLRIASRNSSPSPWPRIRLDGRHLADRQTDLTGGRRPGGRPIRRPQRLLPRRCTPARPP